jgi:hypothetical protein
MCPKRFVICLIGQKHVPLFGIRDHSQFPSMGIEKRRKAEKKQKSLDPFHFSLTFPPRNHFISRKLDSHYCDILFVRLTTLPYVCKTNACNDERAREC